MSPASRLSRSTAANRPFYRQFFLDPWLIGLEYPFELMEPLMATMNLTAGLRACLNRDDGVIR